jgi:hypothetical protein
VECTTLTTLRRNVSVATVKGEFHGFAKTRPMELSIDSKTIVHNMKRILDNVGCIMTTRISALACVAPAVADYKLLIKTAVLECNRSRARA